MRSAKGNVKLKGLLTGKLVPNELNVREIFENYTIEEIEEIAKRVNGEIEKKKEELRVLVGERYRDLIDAADTIENMRISSISAVTRIHDLNRAIGSLPNHLPSIQRKLDNSKLNPVELDFALELKFAFNIPRLIHMNLYKGKVSMAYHLYNLYVTKIMSKEIYKSWSHMIPDKGDDLFKEIIADCDRNLRDLEQKNEVLSDSILIVSLMTKTDIPESLRKFLKIRVLECQGKLEKSREEFVSALAVTLQSLHAIFVDPQHLPDSSKFLKNLKLSKRLVNIRRLPKVVIEYNTQVIQPVEDLKTSVLVETVLDHFLLPLKKFLEERFTENKYLNDITSLKELRNYEEHVKTLTKAKCEDIMRIVLKSSKNLWDDVFQSTFLQQCKKVCESNIGQVFSNELQEEFQRLRQLDEKFDVASFVWKNSSKNSKLEAIDELKLSGISPHSAEFCEILDQGLRRAYDDLQYSEDPSLRNFMSENVLTSFKSFVKNASDVQSSFFMGRFASVAAWLCPTLWKLMNKEDSSDLRAVLATTSEEGWTQGCQIMLQEFDFTISAYKDNLSDNLIISILPIQEEFSPAEADSLKPSILVPIIVSTIIYESLFKFCLNLGKIGPQSVPNSVMEKMRIHIGKTILDLYNTWIEKFEKKISPQFAIQLIFDVKFVQWFHFKLKEDSEPLLLRLNGFIDPFDLDIVNNRLKNNLKKFLFENHLTLGLLFGEESQSVIAQNFKMKQSQNIPILERNSITLPLLPI